MLEVDLSTLSVGGYGWDAGQVHYHTVLWYYCVTCNTRTRTNWGDVKNRLDTPLQCNACMMRKGNEIIMPDNVPVGIVDKETLGTHGNLVALTKVWYACTQCGRHRNGKWIKIRNADLSKIICRSCFASNKRVPFNENAFDNLTPESLYWLGYISGDGNITQPVASQKKVSIKSKDVDILNKFGDFLGIPGRKSGDIVWVYSDKIAEILDSHGITTRKSITLKVSDALAQSRDFWRGMVDSDGCIGYYNSAKRGGKWPALSFVSGSIELMNQFVDYTQSVIGKHGGVSEDKRPNNHCYCYKVNGQYAVAMFLNLYEGCSVSESLDRKRNKAMFIIEQEKKNA